MNRETETKTKMLPEGLAGGFHYGTTFAPCNGILITTKYRHKDGRQIYKCDACGSACVKSSPLLVDGPQMKEGKCVGKQR